MNRRTIGNAALLVGAAGLMAAVVFISTRRSPPVTGELTEAIRTFEELERELLAGRDSSSLRRRLVDQLRGAKASDTRLALGLFADADYEAAAAALTTSSLPFDLGVRGCALLQLGMKADAAECLRRALAAAPPEWPLAEVFREALAKAAP